MDKSRILLCLVMVANGVLATETNLNPQTDFFAKELPDKALIEQDLAQKIASAQQDLAAQTATQVLGISEAEIAEKSAALDSINAHDLANVGLKEANKAENSYYQTVFIDKTSSLNQAHAKDAKLIADKTEDLMHQLTQGLRDLGVDCETVAGNTEVTPDYHLKIKKETEKDTQYNQTMCEELRNQYSCRDNLSVQCSEIIAEPKVLALISTNLPVLMNTPGYARFGSTNGHWLSGGSGTRYDFYVDFNVPDPKQVLSFTLGYLGFDDWALVKLNDQIVWTEGGVDRLEVIGWGRVRINGSGGWGRSERGQWFGHTPNREMQPQLKPGNNRLAVTVIVGGMGGLLFDLKFAHRACNKWQSSWDEQCTRD